MTLYPNKTFLKKTWLRCFIHNSVSLFRDFFPYESFTFCWKWFCSVLRKLLTQSTWGSNSDHSYTNAIKNIWKKSSKFKTIDWYKAFLLIQTVQITFLPYASSTTSISIFVPVSSSTTWMSAHNRSQRDIRLRTTSVFKACKSVKDLTNINMQMHTFGCNK